VVKTAGSVVDRLIVKDKSVMIFGLGAAAKRADRMPSTRMGIAALRAVALDAARIIGCENRIGRLEPGKDADFLILGGHPFFTHSVPEAVFIDGKLVYQRGDRENN
jgi:cytosine/adenosine deaminase-related metal-dependent hydrolase